MPGYAWRRIYAFIEAKRELNGIVKIRPILPHKDRRISSDINSKFMASKKEISIEVKSRNSGSDAPA